MSVWSNLLICSNLDNKVVALYIQRQRPHHGSDKKRDTLSFQRKLWCLSCLFTAFTTFIWFTVLFVSQYYKLGMYIQHIPIKGYIHMGISKEVKSLSHRAHFDPSLNTQSCNKRPFCRTLKFENLRSPKKKRVFFTF